MSDRIRRVLLAVVILFLLISIFSSGFLDIVRAGAQKNNAMMFQEIVCASVCVCVYSRGVCVRTLYPECVLYLYFNGVVRNKSPRRGGLQRVFATIVVIILLHVGTALGVCPHDFRYRPRYDLLLLHA